MILTGLIVVIAGILLLSIVLLNNFQQQNILFRKKQNKLLNTIATIKQKQISLNQKVKISEEFNINYQKSQNAIATSIYEAHLELIKKNFDKKEL